MAVLVTGGAGYIGSHTIVELLKKGEKAVILDNLEKGHRNAVPEGRLYIGDLRDESMLDAVFKENDIESVIHFAAYSLVGESVEAPGLYYNNNLAATLLLLSKMKEYDVKRIVFSSTAAVYGEPKTTPIQEQDETIPENPYGETKLATERALRWFDSAHGIKYISLRYFNAAGAHPSGKIGEDHNPETHLIPIVMETALGKREKVLIFGSDYDTSDGTCIRDYIHVTDLADAHLLALDSLRVGRESGVYNLGNGRGFSVNEVIEAAERVTGRGINRQTAPRRSGDPAVLVASSEKIIKELGWKPRFNSLETIIDTAWKWHSTHPDGYGDRKV